LPKNIYLKTINLGEYINFLLINEKNLLVVMYTIFIFGSVILIINFRFIDAIVQETPVVSESKKLPSATFPTNEKYPLCPAGFMVMHAGTSYHQCLPMPVNINQSLDIPITSLTLIKEFPKDEPIPVSHTRLILSDRFDIKTNFWWPTLLRSGYPTTLIHALIIETVDSSSKSKALELGFKELTDKDLPQLMLSADPYIGTELSSSGGSTWPNITIGKEPWWWPYSFKN
jgi:hypothetical protein